MTRPNWLPEPPDGWSPWSLSFGKWRTEVDCDCWRWVYCGVEGAKVVSVAGYADGEREGEQHKVVTRGSADFNRLLRFADFAEWLPTSPTTPGLWRYSDGIADGVAQVCLDGGGLVALIPGVARKGS